MADDTTTTGGGPTNPYAIQSQPEPDNPVPKSDQLPPPPPSPQSQQQLSDLPPSLPQTSNPTAPVTRPVISQPQSVQPFAPPAAPSFRPVAAPPPVRLPTVTPQFTPLPTPPNYQSPGVQPPGVGAVPPPSVLMPPVVSGAGAVAVSSLLQRSAVPYAAPGQPPNLALRPYAQLPNGCPVAQGTIPGILHYPSRYQPMVRPAFLAQPPGAVGILPSVSRPPVPVIRSPIIPPVVRPVIPSITPTEKPQTTVYVGKIASTMDNDFMLSVLELCGAVKSWKRAQDPTSGALKGFGFCEFESAEGVLRALRLLSKLNLDGQELMLKVDQANKEYLDRYVNKKTENSKNVKVTETEDTEKEPLSDTEKNEPVKPSEDDSKKADSDAANKEKNDNLNFGLVTDQDREADQEASEKLLGMIEERLKMRPVPPPPPPPPPLPTADGSGNSNSELPSQSRDGDSDVDIVKKGTAEDKNDHEMTVEGKSLSEHEKPETSTPDRSSRNDRRSKERERDLKWEKARQLERYEREREQERAKRERQREYKIREDEHRYKLHVKEWESREREKEHMRKMEKEREKKREQERKWEIDDQEHESDDGYSKKRKYKSSGEERKRRQREKEEDLADRLKEEEEIAEAKRKEDKEQELQKQQEKEASKVLSVHANNGNDKAMITDDANAGSKDKAFDGNSSHGFHIGDAIIQNGHGDEPVMGSIPTPDSRHSGNAPVKKLGFGLVGSGKRTAVPSVFHEEHEDAHKDKKMRPLVPIDYSTEELQAVQPSVSGATSLNLVAAAEFAKHISNVNVKEERPDTEKERSRRSNDKSSHRDRDRSDEQTNCSREESRRETFNRDKDRDHQLDKVKTPDNQKLFDAKQLIDTIPKTRDQLFSYEINWSIYDKNQLHERMRPWISKKITEFLGEEETTLVDYIVSSTQEHMQAAEMLDRLQTILDDEAEMFVLKMWRMLIFEIKRVETGLALLSKS